MPIIKASAIPTFSTCTSEGTHHVTVDGIPIGNAMSGKLATQIAHWIEVNESELHRLLIDPHHKEIIKELQSDLGWAEDMLNER